jgi:ribosome biogenesis GTPase
MSDLTRLGWSPFFEEQRGDARELDPRELQFARVILEERGLYRLAGDVDGPAEVSGRFRHDAASAADFPAVGDWVGATPGDRAIIHVRLARRSTISRAASGPVVEEQVIAANVDTMLVVTAAVQDLNARRLERYLTMVWDAGAAPVVVLNKIDLADDVDAVVAALRARLPFVDVIAVSALNGQRLESLDPYLRPASTLALVGSSGVGKSTLVNRLLGREAQRVAAIRDSDGRGRHTTTARQLVELPGGALLIDTPGMRGLQPWADEDAVDAAFDDITDLAEQCRFGDCQHASEPGCAVLAAVADGSLHAERLDNYRRLLRESAFENRKHDKAAAAELKQQWKQIHKAAKKMHRDRDRQS